MKVLVGLKSGCDSSFREGHPLNLPLRPNHRRWIEAHRTSKAAMVRMGVLRAVIAKRNHQPQMATALLGPQTIQLHPRKPGAP